MSLNGYSWVEGNVPNAIDPSGNMSQSLTSISSINLATPLNSGMCSANMSPVPSMLNSGGICCVGVVPVIFCYECDAFPPFVPTFEPDDYEDALEQMISLIDEAGDFVFDALISAVNQQIWLFNLNPVAPDLPYIPDIDTIVEWARGELGLTSNTAAVPVEGFLTPELDWVEDVTHYSQQDINQMRVQIQRNAGEDYSVVAIALSDVGVSALQIRTGMEAMYNSLSVGASWIPRNKYEDVRSAIIRMSERLSSFVAGGGVTQGGQVAQEIIQRPSFRLDLENNRGHNLRL